ncbi:DUF1707 domain-containing protein [Streptacidiphilus sp. 4-A2]|nr:DUF1707 domain-containing protein [Streptacidiphilus sp. 4-A2]
MDGQDRSSGPDPQPEPQPEPQPGPGSEPQPGPRRQPAVRASDAEREALVERLNAACGEGRLDLEEFSERLELAYAARTRAELDALVEDLPQAVAVPAPVAPAAKGRSWHVSPLGGLRRGGSWRVPAETLAVTLIGGLDLDLTEAELDAPVVTVRQFSVIGGARVLVPPGVRVEVSGFSLLGGRRVDADERAVGPGAPVVRLTSFSILGGVQVRTARSSSRSRVGDGRPDGSRRERDYDELARLRAERRALHQQRRDERRGERRDRRRDR